MPSINVKVCRTLNFHFGVRVFAIRTVEFYLVQYGIEILVCFLVDLLSNLQLIGQLIHTLSIEVDLNIFNGNLKGLILNRASIGWVICTLHRDFLTSAKRQCHTVPAPGLGATVGS